MKFHLNKNLYIENKGDYIVVQKSSLRMKIRVTEIYEINFLRAKNDLIKFDM